MTRLSAFFLFWMLCSTSFLLAEWEGVDRQVLLDLLEEMDQEYFSMGQKLHQLQKILGVSTGFEQMEPLSVTEEGTERFRLRMKEGIKLYHLREYLEAKEAWQRAWEGEPDIAEVQYNLGLVYYRLGNLPLSKKMFKGALEQKKTLPYREEIQEFLDGKNVREEEDPEDLVRSELINLKKEADSYMRSQKLDYPRKMRTTLQTVDKLLELTKESEDSQRNYLPFAADTYAAFECYEKALSLLSRYEESMEGKVLPDGYHTKKLQLEDKQREQGSVLATYVGNQPPSTLRRALRREMKELEIFAEQLHKFVDRAEEKNPDFQKITTRLGEYRWANRLGRHVIVVNRYEELLYSSLAGTLPLADYQDRKGQKFLRHLLRLADRLELKQVEFFEVELAVRSGEQVRQIPYLVLYTYIPKHEIFVVVRFPKEDLSS